MIIAPLIVAWLYVNCSLLVGFAYDTNGHYQTYRPRPLPTAESAAKVFRSLKTTIQPTEKMQGPTEYRVKIEE